MTMTAKAHVLELIQKLPDAASYEEIMREIELLAGIREAQRQIARGEGFSVDEILKEMRGWLQPTRK
jgi:hypothetical protein